jgi:hypothetical protein
VNSVFDADQGNAGFAWGLLGVCDSLRERAHVRLAHPTGDIHRLGSHHMGVGWNDGAYLPFALKPSVKPLVVRRGDCLRI